MSLTTTVPILPSFEPGQAWVSTPTPVRAPTWHLKRTPKWNNSRQQAVNGHTLVVKYWTAPLWDFEFTYGYIKDNPNDPNSFYPVPIPYTDFEILSGFFNGVQGGGSEFAYQPPDSAIGGSFSITAVAGNGNLWTLYVANNLATTNNNYASISGLTTATWLNGQLLPIIRASNQYIVVYFSHGNLALTADSGTALIGQQLANPDANNNVELRHSIGGYPNFPLSGTPSATTPTTEPVQLIDSATLTVSGGGTYTLEAADTFAPYQGLVLNYSASPTPPLLARFNYYYLCRFTEDNMEFENFQNMLWSCSSFKFEQVRI